MGYVARGHSNTTRSIKLKALDNGGFQAQVEGYPFTMKTLPDYEDTEDTGLEGQQTDLSLTNQFNPASKSISTRVQHECTEQRATFLPSGSLLTFWVIAMDK